ncbi:MAG: hypothetical protein V4537_16955 [Pseudomonadota bacterium]
METVFVAGSIAIGTLAPEVVQRIETMVEREMAVVVGDADGADSAIQACLLEAGATRVTVYCSGRSPRNNIGGWPVEQVFTSAAPGTRAFFTAKDVEMAQVADYGLMIWDSRSTGTLSNIIELVARRRTSVVFVNKHKAFMTVGDVAALDRLVAVMSDSARLKAETKMRLSKRIDALRSDQLTMPV